MKHSLGLDLFMLPNLPENVPFVGFVRVSTPKQKDKGHSLDVQCEAIRTAFKDTGRLLGIFGDDATGMGTHAHNKNLDLVDVIRLARRHNAIVVVTEISRLGRSPAILAELEVSGISVFSLDLRRIVTPKELERSLLSAEAFGKRLRRNTSDALERAKKRGRPAGNPTNLSDASKRAAISKRVNKETLTENVAEVLTSRDPENKMTAREVAELLNSLSMTTAQGHPWNVDRIARHLKAARALIRFEGELDLND